MADHYNRIKSKFISKAKLTLVVTVPVVGGVVVVDCVLERPGSHISKFQ